VRWRTWRASSARLYLLAGAYRSFLDAMPYRRADGRSARALPRGRTSTAYAEWEVRAD
jgi:hypothetical protein